MMSQKIDSRAAYEYVFPMKSLRDGDRRDPPKENIPLSGRVDVAEVQKEMGRVYLQLAASLVLLTALFTGADVLVKKYEADLERQKQHEAKDGESAHPESPQPERQLLDRKSNAIK